MFDGRCFVRLESVTYLLSGLYPEISTASCLRASLVQYFKVPLEHEIQSDLFFIKYLFLIFQSVYKSVLVIWTNILPVSPHSLCLANSSEQKPFFKSTYIADCPMFYQATPTGYHQFCLS